MRAHFSRSGKRCVVSPGEMSTNPAKPSIGTSHAMPLGVWGSAFGERHANSLHDLSKAISAMTSAIWMDSDESAGEGYDD